MTDTALSPRASLLGTLTVWAASEAVARGARIGVTMLAARVLAPGQLGTVALVLAIGEILKAMTDHGAGQRIVAAARADLEATSNTAHRLFVLWCAFLFTVACAIAFGLHAATGADEAAVLLVVFAAQFLVMPFGSVPYFRALRAGQGKAVAGIAGGQVVASAGMAAVLLIVWPSPAAMILPRLLTAPFWAIAIRRLHPWRMDRRAGYAPVRPFLRFGGAVLGVEGVKAMRVQADKLIVGGVLGMEALGVWFFAVNAGLGLASSFCNAFAIALFPHLCAAAPGDRRRAALTDGLRLALMVLMPLTIVQAMLAPVYVPLIFGESWAGMSGLVGLLCLAAVPTTLWTAMSQWLRAEDRAGVDLRVSTLVTVALMAAVALAAPFGLHAVAVAYLAAATLSQGIASLFILRRTRRCA